MYQPADCAVVCCSDGRHISEKDKIDLTAQKLGEMGLHPVFSESVYAADGIPFAACAENRAAELMKFYKDDHIKHVFDISGGDIANELLPYLDFELIADSNKTFWGYSDLTTIINAIYTKTGKHSVLYQIKNLAGDCSEMQFDRLSGYLNNNSNELFDVKFDILNGSSLSGIVVGGNIRCLLKLAGTPYFPDMRDKLLLLEALGSTTAQTATYLSQLKQMGVFNKISGIILGTFTKMEQTAASPTAEELVLNITDQKLPVAKTYEVGHNSNSKAIIIGKKINIML